MIEDITILPPLSNSDHNVISFSHIVEERMSDDSTVRIVDYNKADWEGIRDVLGRVEWDEWLTDNATTEENLETPPSLKVLARAFLQERERDGGEVYG